MRNNFIRAEKINNDVVRYSTLLKGDDVYIYLYIDKFLGYATNKDLVFEDVFMWTVDKFTNKALRHSTYNRIVETDYSYNTGQPYELQWKTLILTKKVKDNSVGIEIGLIEDDTYKSNFTSVSLGTEGSSERIDYVLYNNSYPKCTLICAKDENMEYGAIKLKINKESFEIC